MSPHELVSERNTISQYEVAREDQRRAAINVVGAHLRRVPAVPDRAAIMELFDMLGLKDLAES